MQIVCVCERLKAAFYWFPVPVSLTQMRSIYHVSPSAVLGVASIWLWSQANAKALIPTKHFI